MSNDQATKVLLVTASARIEGSSTREMADEVLQSLRDEHGELSITKRDLRSSLPFISETWMAGAFSESKDRTAEQKEALRTSDDLIAELTAADIIVIATPIYNFGAPAALKAWIDQVVRARVTFKYTENGPVGLLKDRPVIVVTASGGTELGGDIDYLSGYLRHILGFIGLKDVRMVPIDRAMVFGEQAIEAARASIENAIAR